VTKLGFTPEVENATAHIYEKVNHLVTEPEWRLYAPLIYQINRLKEQQGAVILAHNYQPVEIFHGIADFTGSSLELAWKARQTEAEPIVLCGVSFMADTAKLLNPERTVLLPSREAGCSLAESITAEDVRKLREQYPDIPVVTYVNTSAEVKAASDVCCTSSNAVEVVEALDSDSVIVIPDEYLAAHIAEKTSKEVIDWQGRCVVHEDFRTVELKSLRKQYEDIAIAAHPECAPDVQREADVVGSTSQLIDFAGDTDAEHIALITECTMSDNIAQHFPDTEFTQPCSLCPYMKEITLENVLEALQKDQHKVTVDPETRRGATEALDRMFDLTN
jgi:quinolinate synthase